MRGNKQTAWLAYKKMQEEEQEEKNILWANTRLQIRKRDKANKDTPI